MSVLEILALLTLVLTAFSIGFRIGKNIKITAMPSESLAVILEKHLG